jgi:secreted trypsin-like serine protease
MELPMFRRAILSSLAITIVLATLAWPAQAQNPAKPKHIKPFIVGGTTADIKDFPWIVGLWHITLGGVLCGGTLIEPSLVLTAAHCFYDDTGKVAVTATDIEARTGNNKIADGKVTKAIKIIIHEDYNHSTHENDIALVQLREEVKEPTKGQWIQSDRIDLPKDTELTIIGWGATSEGGATSSVLRKATVKAVDKATCNLKASYDGKIKDGMMCAGYAAGSIDSCQGDSGGPLLRWYNIKQVGIVSWGEGCAKPNKFGVYTDLTKYEEWIVNRSSSTPVSDPDCFRPGSRIPKYDCSMD